MSTGLSWYKGGCSRSVPHAGSVSSMGLAGGAFRSAGDRKQDREGWLACPRSAPWLRLE